jgi:hypothetical protein
VATLAPTNHLRGGAGFLATPGTSTITTRARSSEPNRNTTTTIPNSIMVTSAVLHTMRLRRCRTTTRECKASSHLRGSRVPHSTAVQIQVAYTQATEEAAVAGTASAITLKHLQAAVRERLHIWRPAASVHRLFRIMMVVLRTCGQATAAKTREISSLIDPRRRSSRRQGGIPLSIYLAGGDNVQISAAATAAGSKQGGKWQQQQY